MRQIHIADDMTMRFPGRESEFDEGVEVGLVAALMSLGQGRIRRRVSPANLDQLVAVAAEFGYRLGGKAREGDFVEVVFLSPAERSRPKLVYARAEAAG